MIVATWNVNSVRARLHRIREWLDLAVPDVLCLQELKCPEAKFPYEAFEELGYHAQIAGQKSKNGVAVLSRSPSKLISRQLGEEEDARYVEVSLQGMRIINVYAPAGGLTLSDPKYRQKLRWYGAFLRMLERRSEAERPAMICGDFNIAPADRDAARPNYWRNTPVAHQQVREFHQRLLDLGMVDLCREHHPDTSDLYTWWGYQQRMFERNDGLRLDHVFVDHELSLRSSAAYVDTEERSGEKPSDHAPVLAHLDGI